jgi:hypothetical protein
MIESQLPFLLKKYKKDLTIRLNNSNEAQNLLLINPKTFNNNYFDMLFFSYCRLLKLEQTPVYESRQNLLKSIFMDSDKIIHHSSKIDKSSSTLMGGNSEDDPFYDPNWTMTTYIINGITYSRIIKNLTVNFFLGTRSDWQNFHNQTNYIGSISLEECSISEFNILFTPTFNSEMFDNEYSNHIKEFSIKYDAFLAKYQYVKDFSDKTDDDFRYSSKDDTKKLYLMFNKKYIDENGIELIGECYNMKYSSIVEIGSILQFNSGFRTVTNISIIGNEDLGHYIEIESELRILSEYEFPLHNY